MQRVPFAVPKISSALSACEILTAAHAAPSLYLPLAALGLAALPVYAGFSKNKMDKGDMPLSIYHIPVMELESVSGFFTKLMVRQFRFKTRR